MFAVIVAIGVSFNLGQRARLSSMTPSLNHASIVANARLRGEPYMVSARPSESGAGGSSGGFLPTAVAADPAYPPPTASSSSADRQIDDLLNSDSPAATFQQVYLLLKDQYVERIDSDEKMAHGAAATLLASLDEPNSRFLERDERKSLEDESTGLFQGIGASLTVRRVVRDGDLTDRQITVIDALPGTPAAAAGLRTGDVITAVNSHWIIGYDPFAAQAKLFKKLAKDQFDLGKAVDATEKKIQDGYSTSKAQTLLDTSSKDPIVLTVERPGVAQPIQMTLNTSAPTQVKDIESRRLADGNGYIVVNVFSGGTAKDFEDALGGLGAVKGLVVDLRDCSGGLLDQAVIIAKAL